jgi:tRNA-binding EMAP/Myf-like protein
MKEKIDFSKFIEISNLLEIKIGVVVGARRIPKKDKLLELKIAFGTSEGDRVNCVTNLGEFYEPEDFLRNKLPFIMNLEPSKLGGVLSEVMLMVSDLDNSLEIDLEKFPVGSKLM